MTMRFPYRPIPVRRPVVSLGGRRIRPRPLVLATLVGPSGIFVDRALLDTAADDTVFPDAAAITAGVDLTNAPTGEASGIGGAPLLVRYAVVELRLTDGAEFRRWPAWVAFAGAPSNSRCSASPDACNSSGRTSAATAKRSNWKSTPSTRVRNTSSKNPVAGAPPLLLLHQLGECPQVVGVHIRRRPEI